MNYLQVDCFWPFFKNYVFVDTVECGYEQILKRNQIRIKILREYIKPDSPFRLVICRVKKKDENIFYNCLEQIRNKALLTGYREYDDICEWLKQCERELEQKNEKNS